MADYNNFITPYYEIQVGDAAWKRKVNLPHHILRLVTKIEIREAFVSPENTLGATTATISFIEGSREPASQYPGKGTDGLYQISTDGKKVDMDIAGSITNRVGSVVDLRFSGNSGITFMSASEKKTGKLSSKLIRNVEGKKVSRKYKSEPQNPTFLFDAHNKVKITWGYKEDPSTRRSLMLTIISVETTYSDSGPTTINIQLSDFGALHNQIVPKSAVAFGTVIGVKGNALIEFKDLKTDVLIRKIAETTGMAAIISKNLLSDTLDKGKQKMWIAGESFHEFLSRLAKESNCYYKVINDPTNNGKPTIFFVKRETFESKPPISKDKYFYVEYKHPGSLIKSVTVNADFANPTGAGRGVTDSVGDKMEQDETVDAVQFKNKEGQITTNVENVDGFKGITQNLLGGNYTGNYELTPSESAEYNRGQSLGQAYVTSRLVLIEITSIGYPKFIPGTYNVGGLGVRYSGKYRILNVEHVIDSTGYITRMTGSTASLPTGGTAIPDAAPGKETEATVGVQMFKDKNGKVDPKADKNNIIDETEVINKVHHIYGSGTGSR